MTTSRPPLPTSSEWLESDGERWVGFGWCKERGGEGERFACYRAPHISGHHTCFSDDGKVSGRWYTDGPFVEAK